ncbi:hypothetical protein [Spirosoma sp. KUDC1026]|uniref:hypothetical protein n=1 Tax=Spirosoma sp. KUDC1026 TaxID=2745947 RepID=UPI00159BB160|nr:hypothetical protein [Spirosoma sp. KUDC1026]QKZ15150.1 hypothetical protein HU175_22015 [Spirosoma sp. KUDC1026]
MNTTDDTRPYYGKLPPIHERARKKIYTSAKSCMDGEDATQAVKGGSQEQKDAFVDELPDVICYEGYEGLQAAYNEFLQSTKKAK